MVDNSNEIDIVSSEVNSWANLRAAKDANSFAAAWLDIQCQIIDAEVRLGVVILGKEGDTTFSPAAVWPVGSMGTPNLIAAVEAAIADRKTIVRKDNRSINGQPPNNNIASPIFADDNTLMGVIAIDVEHGSDAELKKILEQLEWGSVWLESFVKRNRYSTADRLVTVLELVATSLHYAHFQEAATAVSTELAGILECERVSIGFLKGQHARILALSHSASFSKKANVIRAIEAAMDEAIEQQVTVVYPSSVEGPIQVTRSHAELVKDHGIGSICTIPFTEGERILGAMTLELPDDQTFDPSIIKLCEHAASLLGPLLDIKRKDDRWLFTKAIDSLKEHTKNLVGPRHTALKLTIFCTVSLIVFFSFAIGEYRVTADARLEGTVQRAIAVPMSGFVTEANVRAGDVVKQGDLMFSLDDRDLRLERLKWVSQKSQYSRQLSEALAEHDRARVKILGAQVEQANAQIALVEEQLERIKVTAPFDSFVVSGDLSQALGAPVERGDILFEVAPLNAYRIILKVDEEDISELSVGQTGHIMLTGLLGEVLAFKVEKITPVSTAEEGVNFFKIEAQLLDEKISVLRPGMQGVGKVYIDQRKLIWIWTHKIGQWWRMFIWSWWP